MSNVIKKYMPFALSPMDLFLLDKRGRSEDDPLYGIDIEKEYLLVQEKRSALSARLRRLVVLRYERAKAMAKAEADSEAKENTEEVVKK